MTLEPTTVQVLLLDKADSSIRKWLLQLQNSSNPGATIIQMYNCTLDAIKKTLSEYFSMKSLRLNMYNAIFILF